MPDFINIPIETEPDAIAQIAFDFMEESVPGWEPNDGNLDVWILSAGARQAAVLRDVASDVPIAILRYIGFFIFGLAPVDATAATALTNWTMQDNAGYTILDGTNVGVRDSNGDLIPFVTVGDFTVPALSTTASNIPIAALEEGANGSNLGSVGGNVELVDAIAGPAAITLVAKTSGGSDDEDDQVYISRLISYIRLMSPRPVKAQNFADLARNIAGVWRAAAIEGYNAVSGLTGQPQTVTVFPVDEAGAYVGDTIANQYLAYVTPMMSPNFSVFKKAVTVRTVNVSADITVYTGWDKPDRETAAEAAIVELLDAGTWGSPPFGDGRDFIVTNSLKVNDIIARLYHVDGIQYVSNVLINGVASDLTWANPTTEVSVPQPGSIAVTAL
jgi:hypothetical protein